MTFSEFLLAVGIGAGTGCFLAVQTALLREWNRNLPLRWRPVNYILGDGTLLGAFALWGWLTGHIDQVAIYCDILVIAGLCVVVMYALLERLEAQVRALRAARKARREAQEAAQMRAVVQAAQRKAGAADG